MTRKTISPPDATLTSSTPERIYLHRAGFFGTIPPIAAIIMLALAPTFPFPDNNMNGQAYLDYLLPHRTSELQSILWAIESVTIVMFLLLLATAYLRRAGQLVASGVSMICFAVAWLTVQMIVLGAGLVMALTPRGYPSFGNDPSELLLITYTWNMVNGMYAFGLFLLGLALIAVAVANRAHPLLPPMFGGWGAAAVGVLTIGITVGTLFISTGPFSPGGFLAFAVTQGSAILWAAAVSVVLLRTHRAERQGFHTTSD